MQLYLLEVGNDMKKATITFLLSILATLTTSGNNDCPICGHSDCSCHITQLIRNFLSWQSPQQIIHTIMLLPSEQQLQVLQIIPPEQYLEIQKLVLNKLTPYSHTMLLLYLQPHYQQLASNIILHTPNYPLPRVLNNLLFIILALIY